MASRPRLYAQPNITPLIDVLLVLLIVFLLGVQLSQEGIDLSLPRESAHTGSGTQIVLEYSADRRITVNSQPVTHAALQSSLRAIYRDRRDRTMWLSGAGSLRYGDVVEVIDAAKGAGVERVGVITPGMAAAARLRGRER